MRQGWLALLGFFITAMASGPGPAPASTSAQASIWNESPHALSMDTCKSVRLVAHDTWRIHAYVAPANVSAIMLAATDGNTTKVRAGLAALPPDQVARWRQTALLTAVISNRPDTVRGLIAEGADPDARAWVPPYTDRVYRASLVLMSHDPRFGGSGVVKSLQQQGLMQNKGQWFPHMLNQAANCDEAEVIDALVEGGASVNAHLPSGIGALEVAVFEGNPRATRALLDHGADTCYFDHRAATYAKRTHRKPQALAAIARKNGLPADLVARLQCHAP